jgi:hypothetical protein
MTGDVRDKAGEMCEENQLRQKWLGSCSRWSRALLKMFIVGMPYINR